MNGYMQDGRGRGFAMGLLAGTVAGAALMMYFAPKVRAEVRRRVTDSAKDLGDRASECYDEVSARVGTTVDELTSRSQEVRDAAADTVARGTQAVARGAREVERFADAATKAVVR